jgi:hypothetical protein
MDTYFYLLLIEDDTDPNVQGPFVTAAERDEAAREYRAEGFEGGIFPLDIQAEEEPLLVSTEPYSGDFFEEEEL